jgi:uncharacterized protein
MITTRASLRRLLLSQQGLLGLPTSKGSHNAAAWVQGQGFIQLDIASRALVPGHDLILASRLPGYRAGNLEAALYEAGELFEHDLHVHGALPVADYMLTCDPSVVQEATPPGSAGETLLALLADRGPLSRRDLLAELRAAGWSERRLAERSLEALYAGGAVLVCRRESGLEYYDLAERVLPRCRRAPLPAAEDRLRALARRLLSVLAPVTRAMWSQALNNLASRTHLGLAAMRREKGRVIAALLAKGEAVQVEVADPPEWYMIPASWVPQLGVSPVRPEPSVSFLSPLDPVVWDRQRARDLLGFDWRGQVYAPPDGRRSPADSTLPILYGDRLVGRIEVQMNWSSQRLLVQALHLDDPVLSEQPAFRASCQAALRCLAELHDAHGIRGVASLPSRLLP